MSATYRIFVSCVSKDFANIREILRSKLKSAHRDVHVQGYFPPSGADALLSIDHYIRASDKIIHVLGNHAGAVPEPQAVRILLEHRPDLVRRVPQIADLAPAFSEITYTFWEAWLALYHGCELL